MQRWYSGTIYDLFSLSHTTTTQHDVASSFGLLSFIRLMVEAAWSGLRNVCRNKKRKPSPLNGSGIQVHTPDPLVGREFL